MNPQEPDLPLSDEDALSPTLPDLRDRELEGLDPRELIDAGLHSRTAPDKWEPPTPESLARLLPQYEIDALLGRGGMGAVYRGRQVTLDRRVAIKLLPAELTRDAEFVARFEREARTLAKLHHPGIVLVHDFGQTSEGHLYFVMEFVDGTDLHRIIHGPGLDCAQALEIVGQICDALQYAHSQGVVHRDIKPANVILALNGRAKLADFGLARPFDDGSGAFTRSNVVMGTPDYMAPEALAGAADHRADLYSLGVMLYEMLTGRPPRGAWAPPSQRVQVDVRLDEVVVRALQEDPELRYQQASEIKTDVDVIRTTPVQGVAEERKGKQNGKTAVPGKKPSRQNAKKSAVGAWIVALGLAAVLGAG
ncbi:MAG TPA: serine/threonine-protein kinase, partial [Verrucomicrobiales bacterium]|nr:serine/threonine-protein kinase [Verrucomicrobiales bacterium]